MSSRCAFAWIFLATLGCTASEMLPNFDVRLGSVLTLGAAPAEATIEALNGFNLVLEVTNTLDPPPFQLPDGRRVTASLQIKDDNGNISDTSLLYRQLIEDGEADLLLGPVPTEDNAADVLAEFAEVADLQGVVSMMHGEAVPLRAQANASGHLFSVGVPARDQLQGALEMLRELGASTIVVAIGQDQPERAFHESMCAGVISHAEGLGLRVVHTFMFEATQLTHDIRTSMTMMPSVLVGCVSSQEALLTVVTSRALSFAPSAMLLANAASSSFVRAVGAPNANYLMAPACWAPSRVSSQDAAGRIFGSRDAFVEAYRDRFGLHPTVRSAAAAAAVLGLLSAVERAGVVSGEAVRLSLAELDEPSFWQRLQFDAETGELQGSSCGVQQVQPIPLSAGREARYLRSSVTTVNRTSEILWPSPGWETKELDIYPCQPGSVVDLSIHVEGSSHGNVTCQPCGVGHHRSALSLTCRACGTNLYSDDLGFADCKVCPPGAECGPNRTGGVPDSKPGYYKLLSGDGQLLYPLCDPPAMCLGGNRCLGQNRGVMCAQCNIGYTVDAVGFGSKNMCGECPDTSANVMRVFLVLVIYALYIGSLAYMTHHSSKSVRAIHSIILKMVVNHVQLLATAYQALELEDMGALDWFATAANNPLEAVLSLDCLLSSHGLRSYEAYVVMGMATVPVVLVVNWLCFFTVAFTQIRRQRIHDKMMGEGSKHKKTDSAPAHHEHTERVTTSSLDAGATATSHHDLKLAPSLSKVLHSHAQPSARALKEQLEKASQDKDWEEDISVGSEPAEFTEKQKAMNYMWVHGTQWTIVWVFILHPIVVHMLLKAISCTIAHGDPRLKENLDVRCDSSEHVTLLHYTAVGFVIYGLGIPLFNFIQLYHVRHRLMNLDVRQKFGFLYNGFEANWYFYEVVYMVRKVAIVLTSIIPMMHVRILTMLLVTIVFFGMHSQANPYDNRDFWVLDHLETMNLLSLMAALQMRLFDRVTFRETSPVVYSVISFPGLRYFSYALCFVCEIRYWWMAISSLLRNSLLKHIEFKKEFMPQHIPWFQSMLLRCSSHTHHFSFDQNTYEFDLSKMVPAERHYVLQAFCDTMESYIMSDKRPFHPGCVVTAVREAVTHCIGERQCRALHLHDILVNSEHDGDEETLDIRMKRWKAEVHHALGARDDVHVQKDPWSVAERRRQDVVQAAGSYTMTAEELHNSLMVCWHWIGEGKNELFVLDEPHCELDTRFLKTYPAAKARAGGTRGARSGRGAASLDSSGSESRFFAFAEKPVEVEESVLRQQHLRAGGQLARLRSETQELRRRVAAAEAGAPVGPANVEQLGPERARAGSSGFGQLAPVGLATVEQLTSAGSANASGRGQVRGSSAAAMEQAPAENADTAQPQAQSVPGPAGQTGDALEVSATQPDPGAAEQRVDNCPGAIQAADVAHGCHEEETVATAVGEQFLFASALRRV